MCAYSVVFAGLVAASCVFAALLFASRRGGGRVAIALQRCALLSVVFLALQFESCLSDELPLDQLSDLAVQIVELSDRVLKLLDGI